MNPDKLEEYAQDSKHEHLMHTNYDYFLDHNDHLFAIISEAYSQLLHSYIANGWDCSQHEIFTQIKEHL
jgi:hypothetical protein